VIPFFVGYAMIFWYLVVRHRRELAGWLWLATAVAGLVAIMIAHQMLGVWTHGRIYVPVLRMLLVAYTLLVGVVGLYLVCLPKGYRSPLCTQCGYDVRGLEEWDPCPECGRIRSEGDPRRRGAVRGRQIAQWGASNEDYWVESAPQRIAEAWSARETGGVLVSGQGPGPSAPEQAPDGAEHEREQGQPHDRRPAKP
jgi:hypothetical protein